MKQDFSALKPEDWTPLTDSQIENWRKMLFEKIGAYAEIMPVEEIEKIRQGIQTQVNTDT